MTRVLLTILCAALSLCMLAIPVQTQAQQPVQLVGPQNLTTNQVSVGTTATLIVPARNRNRIGINVLAANNCAFGGPGVTLTTGYRLQPTAGAQVTVESSAAVYSVCDAVTTVSYMEVN